MPRLLGQSCASLSYAVGQALAPQAPNFCYSLQSRGRVSSHSPQRQVSEQRLSATSKDPPVWDGRQPSWRATFMGSVSAVHVTAGHNALRGSGPDQKLAFDHALAQVGCPDRRIDRLCITCCSPSQPHITPKSAQRRYAASATGSPSLAAFKQTPAGILQWTARLRRAL